MPDCPFTSESVTEGHRDKIGDAMMDSALVGDCSAGMAGETPVTNRLVHPAGEASVLPGGTVSVVRGIVPDIGYDSSSAGFDAATREARPSVGRRPALAWHRPGQDLIDPRGFGIGAVVAQLARRQLVSAGEPAS